MLFFSYFPPPPLALSPQTNRYLLNTNFLERTLRFKVLTQCLEKLGKHRIFVGRRKEQNLLGQKPVLQSIEAYVRFSPLGLGASRFLSVAAVGFDLLGRWFPDLL